LVEQRSKTMRILHVIGNLVQGGIETWLGWICRNVDRQAWNMDFAVASNSPSNLRQELENLGCRVYYCPEQSDPMLLIRNVRRAIKEHGPYDIVHSHLHAMGGAALWGARLAGVPVRIAHSHIAVKPPKTDSLAGQMRHKIGAMLLNRHATSGLAASREAADALFPTGWDRRPGWRILHYGIAIQPFLNNAADGAALRSSLGIPAEAFVAGTAARLVQEKNLVFLVDIAAAYQALDPTAHFLVAGDGPMRPRLEQKIAERGLTGRFHLLGGRNDVPALMTRVMDHYLLPSFVEGLPVSLLEAQAAGLPSLISAGISSEVDVLPGLMTRLSLNEPASRWAQRLHEIRLQPRATARRAAACMRAVPTPRKRSAAPTKISFRNSAGARKSAGNSMETLAKPSNRPPASATRTSMAAPAAKTWRSNAARTTASDGAAAPS